MNKLGKKTLILMVFFTVIVTVFAFGFFRQTPQPAAAAESQGQRVPTAVIYKHLFHHVLALKKKTDESGTNQFRAYFGRKAGLRPDQISIVETVASAYDEEEQSINTRARSIIMAFRAQFPGGRIPRGQTPPPAPAELTSLRQERDQVILHARERLRNQLGDLEFARFDDFVKTHMAPNVQLVSEN